MKFDLDRMRVFMRRFDNPQDAFPSIHVAGTNGKGSVSAMISAVLSSSGLRTGLYTSPHLIRANERFRINGQPISDSDLKRLSRRVMAMKPDLTEFERFTAVAYLWFAEKKIDVAVMEVGLGGRLDATNILRRVLVSVITTIDFDHTEWLGNTLGKIAFEKAGIIKPGVPVVTGTSGAAFRVIKKMAEKKHAPVTHVSFPRRHFKLTLAGRHQQHNAAIAFETIRRLPSWLGAFPNDKVLAAIARARWPGRFERFLVGSRARRKTVILDGAHNPAGTRALVDTIRDERLAPINLLFGALKDKDVRGMIARLAPMAEHVVVAPVPSDRTSNPADVARDPRWNGKALVGRTVEEAWRLLLTSPSRRPWVVAGSLYLVGDIRRRLS